MDIGHNNLVKMINGQTSLYFKAFLKRNAFFIILIKIRLNFSN